MTLTLQTVLAATLKIKELSNRLGRSSDAMAYHCIAQTLETAITQKRDLTDDEDEYIGRMIEKLS